jgi:hypothetical protein
MKDKNQIDIDQELTERLDNLIKKKSDESNALKHLLKELSNKKRGEKNKKN